MYTSHRLRRAATAAAALGLAGAGVPAVAHGALAAPADTRAETPATPAVTASRSTELAAAGDEITVVGRGFAPGARVTVALYGGDTADRTGSRTLVADARGIVATPLRVGTGFAPDAPAFEVRVGAEGGPAAKVAVTFAAQAPAGAPTSLRAAPQGAAEQARAPQAAPQAAAGGAKLTVTPSTGLEPAGASVTVKGSGYVAGSGNGIYVVFGPKEADWTTNAGNYGASKWLKAYGADGINPDGTFSVTLTDVKASYKNGAGKDVDCLKTECYVLTMAAHGSPDRSQDAFVKVSFKGGSTTAGSGTTAGAGSTTGTTTGGTSGTGSTGSASAGGGTSGSTGGAATSGSTGGAGKSGGGSLPLTGPAGLVGASVAGVALVAAGTVAVVTTRRRRGTPPASA
ncbi:hypothetical protein ACIBSV_49870 [Embleya sp. NPDC050154]|uniref:hypothetical protein n=1 Tax=unclassified Embleya TaxID=2699296 RepID=UPI00378D9238